MSYEKNLSIIFVSMFTAFALFMQVAYGNYEEGVQAWNENRFQDAISVWMESAESGDGRSMLALGKAYARGLGVLRNLTEAHKWYNLAASRGIAEAADERNALEVNMTGDERARAEELASQWQHAQTDISSPPVSETPPEESTVESTEVELTSRTAIREAQSLLAELGYQPGPADGLWGAKTGVAFRSFLVDQNLPEFDVLTEASLSALREAAGRSTGIASNDGQIPAQVPQQFSSDTIREAQSLLALLGYNSGPADGSWGPNSVLAYQSFLRDNNLPITDVLTTDSILAIREAAGLAGASTPVISQPSTPQDESGELPSFIFGDSSQDTEAADNSTEYGSTGDQSTESTVSTEQASTDEVGQTDAAQTLMTIISLLTGESLEITAQSNQENSKFENLLKRAPSTTAEDENGWTDLHWAAALNLPETVKKLVQAGMSANISMKADQKQFSTVLRQNLAQVNSAEYIAQQIQEIGRVGASPLHIAALMNSQEAAQMLIDQGARVNQTTIMNETPLFYAISGISIEIAQNLIGQNADINLNDFYGFSPLHMSAYRNSADALILLLENGANIEALTRHNWTSLHVAAWANAREAARVLIARGAELSATTDRNLTPLDLARDKNHTKMVRLLLLGF